MRTGRATPAARAAMLALVAGVALQAVAVAGVTRAVSPRVESAWTASFGTTGVHNSATLRALNTATGTITLAFRRLAGATPYRVTVRRGTCGRLGPTVVSVRTFRSGATGVISTTQPLSAAQVTAVRTAAAGTGRVSLILQAGNTTQCATFAKSLSTPTQIWFSPMPVWSEWPGYGSTDFMSLFAAPDRWPATAGRVQVFKLRLDWLMQVSVGDLRKVVAGLNARDIRIAIEVPPLRPPADASCGMAVEGYGGGAEQSLALIQRVVAAGGSVRFLAMDEPFYYGSLYRGRNACAWSTARIARDAATFVRGIQRAYPGITVGDIEPWPAASAAQLAAWMDAYAAAAGSKLPLLHLDVDWNAAPVDWPARVRDIQAAVSQRGIRFGLIYNGAGEPSDAAWLEHAEANVLAYELDAGGRPDDVIFQSWTDHPDRTLPETANATFTHLVADYTRTRTAITVDAPAAMSDRPAAIGGRVTTLGGAPVAGAVVTLTATPRDGPYQVLEWRGTVPAATTTAVVGLRVNQEGAGPGAADLTFYEFGYSEGGSVNLVPKPHFEAWPGSSTDGTLTVAPSDRDPLARVLHVVASPGQATGFNSPEFGVTPGSSYRAWVAVRVPESSVGAAYVAVFFIAAVEGRRDILPLAPASIPLGSALADASGRYAVDPQALHAGRYVVHAAYPGDDAYWPARARAGIGVP